ncbi:MAG TPA: phosphoadenylyl-sulfate reductase [Parvularculaceae bacterium]|nr:phosphoadenylyl-sulfate reductase [Parvularculaceae bacterium]
MADPTAIDSSNAALADQARVLSARFEGLHPRDIIAEALASPLFSNPAVVSSFGSESAVLLHMIAEAAPAMPVLFIDTGKVFGETLRYRDRLQHFLGLEDVRTVGPRKADVDAADPIGALNRTDPDACCAVRKTAAINRALEPFNSWISGRKRHQSALRAAMDIVEIADGRAKLNPLANWSREDIKAHVIENRLPDHPLLREGYLSIGCMPCSDRVKPGDDPRSGRWTSFEKTECGIHLPQPPKSK